MQKKIVWLRIITTALCVLMLSFIFAQSLQTGQQSSQQSTAVTDVVQDVAQDVAPDSFVATAEGEDYNLLHSAVRKLAHYAEFALFGLLLCFCYATYTKKRIWALLPLGILAVTPLIDEWLQTLTAERVAEWMDIAVDVCGGVTGFGIGLLTLTVVGACVRNAKKKKAQRINSGI
ncbi:MAG: VanZ family protein [Clostridia bacterium]|nr:VanZ family protein [Clostridia bacterium]